MKVPAAGLRGINMIMYNLKRRSSLSLPVLCHKNIIYIVIHLLLYGLCFKVARNSFHFPQTSFTNSFVNTVWFIVSV